MNGETLQWPRRPALKAPEDRSFPRRSECLPYPDRWSQILSKMADERLDVMICDEGKD